VDPVLNAPAHLLTSLEHLLPDWSVYSLHWSIYFLTGAFIPLEHLLTSLEFHLSMHVCNLLYAVVLHVVYFCQSAILFDFNCVVHPVGEERKGSYRLHVNIAC